MLEQKGFRIVEHNWRMGHLEVDLIAENKKEIVFAEVKARTTTYGGKMPEEYVDEDKKRRMTVAANAYIKYRKIEKMPRFDIIGILNHGCDSEYDLAKPILNGKEKFSRILIRRKQKPIGYASIEPTVSMAAENQVP